MAHGPRNVPDFLPQDFCGFLFCFKTYLSKIRKLFVVTSILYKEAFGIYRCLQVSPRAALILLFAIFAYNVVFILNHAALNGNRKDL